jgi:metal-responsive CopG/Arc/MetJ family transcriptional regulator
MRIVTFKAEDWLIEWINNLSVKLRKTRSELIREALLVYISQFEEGKKRGYKVKAYELK